MAIVKMKRLRLFGMRSDRDSLFRKLQKLGCVEISEPAIDLTDPDWAALAKPDGRDLAIAKEQSNLLNNALEILKKYAPGKGGMFRKRPEITDSELFNGQVYTEGLAAAQAIVDAERRLAALMAEQGKVESQKASLQPWLALDLPLEMTGTETVSVILSTVPAATDFARMEAALAEATELAQVTLAGEDRDLKYFLLLCHKEAEPLCTEALRPYGFSRANLRGWTGTAVDNDRLLENRLAALAEEIEAAEEHLVSFGEQRELLYHCIDRVVQDVSREESMGRLVDTDAAFFLDGWFCADQEEELGKILGEYTCAWETCDPTEEEYPDVPVKLRNNFVTKSLNMVTEMYSLPAYNSLDPNPLMAPFFIFFYGFMMADMGYGLLMMLASIFVMKKSKPNGATMRYMIPLLGWCGIATFVMGALTGGFFGDLIPQLVKMINPASTFALPALFSPLDDALMVLIGSLAIGVVQIFTGMAINMYKQIKRGEVLAAICNEGAWFAVFILFAVGLLINQLGICGIAIAVILVLTQGYGKKGIVGKLMGIGGSLYNNITGYFSDILSYSRLMALMLAGAVIAQVFNTLGAITGNVITFFLIAMIGNALNFALNLLGCYVHDMRLQCLEFFGRFYEDGGKPFRPLDLNTKYVDITNKK